VGRQPFQSKDTALPDTTSLILTELRSLRDDFNNYARESAARISVTENDLHGLLGNGQPGRIAKLESVVEQLKQWRWQVVGAAAGCSAVISVLAWFITKGQ
jgi:hypothetical protein